MKVRKLLRHRI